MLLPDIIDPKLLNISVFGLVAEHASLDCRCVLAMSDSKVSVVLFHSSLLFVLWDILSLLLN